MPYQRFPEPLEEFMFPQHKALFEPITLGKILLPNRIVLAPTYVGMGDLKGNVTDQSLCYYFARSSGGVGLVIVEITGTTARSFAMRFLSKLRTASFKDLSL